MFPQQEPASLEVHLDWKCGLGLLLALFILFGVLGAVVTPDAASEGHSLQPPVVLTPDRWTSLRLARDVRTETEMLLQDAARLQHLLDSERPDPIAAMLMAQRLYASHRRGTSATGSARQTLIEAAEIAARAAVGERSYADAIDAYNMALARIQPLASTELATTPVDNPRQIDVLHHVFTPLVLAPDLTRISPLPPPARNRLSIDSVARH